MSFEKKSHIKTDRNFGSFVHYGLGKYMKREFRALGLFYAMIADTDTKNDNTRLKLVPQERKDGSVDYNIAFSASDMGIAFGFGFPNFYSRDLVDKFKLDKNGKTESIDLNYNTFYSIEEYGKISIEE